MRYPRSLLVGLIALGFAGSIGAVRAQEGETGTTTMWEGGFGAALQVEAYKTVAEAEAELAAETEIEAIVPVAEEPVAEEPEEEPAEEPEQEPVEEPAEERVEAPTVIEPIAPPVIAQPEAAAPENEMPEEQVVEEQPVPVAPELEPAPEPEPEPEPTPAPVAEEEAVAVDIEAGAAAQPAPSPFAEEPAVVDPVPEAEPAPMPEEEAATEDPMAEEPAPEPEPQPAPQPESEPQPEPAPVDVEAAVEIEVEAETTAEVTPPAPVVELAPKPEPAPAADTPAKKLSGRDIAVKMDRAQHVKDATRVATMLIERRGEQLSRKMLMRAKRYGVDERSVIRFEEPADVRDTQYLSWVYDDPQKDDDLWVYFPSENMIRRISGGGKKGSFMRSDFANEDIEARAVDDDTHVLQEETEFDGKAVYVIESTPIPIKAKDSSYSKRKIWVDKTIWLPLKVEFYDKRGKLLKTLLHGGIEEIDGVWTATKLIMETPRKRSRTLMQYHDVTYNSGLGDDLFNQSTLKR